MNDKKNYNYEAFVPYVIVKADEQISQEIFDLTHLMATIPNDGDLGKIIREKFLKLKK